MSAAEMWASNPLRIRQILADLTLALFVAIATLCQILRRTSASPHDVPFAEEAVGRSLMRTSGLTLEQLIRPPQPRYCWAPRHTVTLG